MSQPIDREKSIVCILHPGIVLIWDWDAGYKYVVAYEGEDLVVEKQPLCEGFDLIDEETGEQVDLVKSYHVLSNELVRLAVKTTGPYQGKPFMRRGFSTDSDTIAQYAEHRNLRFLPMATKSIDGPTEHGADNANDAND